jgi:hypothetical protein
VSRPHADDIEAREVGEALELASTRQDAALALDAAHRFARGGLKLRVSAADWQGVPSATSAPAEPSFGRPFPTKYAGRCAVCAGSIPAGEMAVYRASDRALAHQHCGAA